MSWTEITGEPEQEIPRQCWVGGYDGPIWVNTAAYRVRPGHWHTLDTCVHFCHPITHWAPFEAPEPPPKPGTVRGAGENLWSLVEHLDDILRGSRAYKGQGELYLEGISSERCQQVLAAWRIATRCEDADGEAT